MKEIATARIKQEFKGSPDYDAMVRKVESDFDSIGREYGDFVTLNDLNAIKRQVRNRLTLILRHLIEALDTTRGRQLCELSRMLLQRTESNQYVR